MTGLTGVNKQPPLKRAAAAPAHSLTSAPAGPEQRAFSLRSSHRHRMQGPNGYSRHRRSQPHHTTPYRSIPCHGVPAITSRATHHPDFTLKSRPKEVDVVSSSGLITSSSRNSLFVPPRLGPVLCLDLNIDGLKLPQEQLIHGWRR